MSPSYAARSRLIAPIVVAGRLVAARNKRDVPEEYPEQGRLAGAVAPDDRQALSGGEVDTDGRAATCLAADRLVEAENMIGEPRAPREREIELPRLERLLGELVAIEEPLCLPHLGLEGMRGAPIGASRLVP